MKFALYRLLTGQIESVVTAPSADYLPALAEGMAYLQADEVVSDDKHYVEGDAIVAMPGKPSRRHEFDFVARAWVLPPESNEVLAAKHRMRRDAELAASDKTQLPDYPITAEKRAEWAAHRDALRNLTELPGFPANFTWPTAPS